MGIAEASQFDGWVLETVVFVAGRLTGIGDCDGGLGPIGRLGGLVLVGRSLVDRCGMSMSMRSRGVVAG